MDNDDNRYESMPSHDPYLKFKIWDYLANGFIAYCPTAEDAEKVTKALNASSAGFKADHEAELKGK